MSRRPSILPADLLGGNSPIPAGDDRRKSIFPLASSHRRSSIGGLTNFLAARKFRKGNRDKGEVSPHQVQINYEPTYQMEPKFRFSPANVLKVLKTAMDLRLDEFQYNAKICVPMIQALTDDIKDRMKQMGWDRYKLVVVVFLGERKDQDVVVTSRCAWDPKVDNFATYTFTNKSLFCTASAYGVYME